MNLTFEASAVVIKRNKPTIFTMEASYRTGAADNFKNLVFIHARLDFVESFFHVSLATG